MTAQDVCISEENCEKGHYLPHNLIENKYINYNLTYFADADK